MVGGDVYEFEGGGGGSISGHTPRTVKGGKGKQKLVLISTGEGGLESKDPIPMQGNRVSKEEAVAEGLGLHKLLYGGGA